MVVKNTKRGRIVRNKIQKGTFKLRVIGSERTLFRLAGENDSGFLFPLGQLHKRQKDAVAYGQEKFAQTATKAVGVVSVMV
jgi:hypothetical protein